MCARRNGVDCVALTVWALLGSFYWDQLVTCENDRYESGVFSVLNGLLAPTQLATVVAQIARGERPRHPFLAEQGWWRHRSRISFPARGEVAA